MTRDIPPADLMVGDYCKAKIPLVKDPAQWKVRACLVIDAHHSFMAVQTASRKNRIWINRSQVVGLGWRKD